MEVERGLAKRPAMQFHMAALQECMWEAQHCPEDLDSGQKKTTGARSHHCFAKSRRAPKGKNINICTESHVNDSVCRSLFLTVLRLGASFMLRESEESTWFHFCL